LKCRSPKKTVPDGGFRFVVDSARHQFRRVGATSMRDTPEIPVSWTARERVVCFLTEARSRGFLADLLFEEVDLDCGNLGGLSGGDEFQIEQAVVYIEYRRFDLRGGEPVFGRVVVDQDRPVFSPYIE
jgi:hypothetical protein